MNTPSLVPNSLPTGPWLTEDTAVNVNAFNAKQSGLRQRIVAAEKAIAAFSTKNPEDITDADFAGIKSFRTDASKHPREGLQLCEEAEAIFPVLIAEAGAYVLDCKSNLNEVKGDWMKKMIDSGHYEDRPFDNRQAGGLGGWQGQLRNSKLIHAAWCQLGHAKTLASSMNDQARNLAGVRQAIRDRLAKLRDKAVAGV